MTHKEKAREIVEMFQNIEGLKDLGGMHPDFAMECATKYVEGKIGALESVHENSPMLSEISVKWTDTHTEVENWQQVKNEIEKL